jgi:hypothetical protein
MIDEKIKERFGAVGQEARQENRTTKPIHVDIHSSARYYD